jgi:transposase InsO family protein
VLAYAASDTLKVNFVLDTVKILIEQHGAELSAKTLYHIDQGSHYKATELVNLLNDASLRRS